jgi:hypothetical protein
MRREIAQSRLANYGWDKPFDANEYRKNPKAIELLYEEMLEATLELIDVREQNRQLMARVAELDKANALLEKEKFSLRRQSVITFTLQTIAVILSGVGVNLLTSDGNRYGWLFLVTALVLEGVAFFVVKSRD